MSSNSQLVELIVDVTHPSKPVARKNNNGLLEACFVHQSQRDSVYLAVLNRAQTFSDELASVEKCFQLIRKYLIRCPPSKEVCQKLLDGSVVILETFRDISSDLRNTIKFVQILLTSITGSMGAKASKKSSDDAKGNKLSERQRITKGNTGNVAPAESNMQDSPFINPKSSQGSVGSKGPFFPGRPGHIPTSPGFQYDSAAFSIPNVQESDTTPRHIFDTGCLSDQDGLEPRKSPANINLIDHRWLYYPPPKSGTAAADAVAELSAWPHRIPHSSSRLFPTRRALTSAHKTEPNWGMRGDFKCANDCCVAVASDSSGTEQLRCIAQIQIQAAQQAALRPRMGYAASTVASGTPFPTNVRSLFSYKRYSEQAPLEMTSAETAAAVTLVLGPEATAGLLGPEYAAILVPDPGALRAGILPGGKPVQVERMASIIIKLVMDMWLQTDPDESFALMTPMLTAALKQKDPVYRIRVFDLLYNLSLHAQMIEPVGNSASGAGGPASTQGGFPSDNGTPVTPLRQLQARLLKFGGKPGHKNVRMLLAEHSCYVFTHLWSIALKYQKDLLAVQEPKVLSNRWKVGLIYPLALHYIEPTHT